MWRTAINGQYGSLPHMPNVVVTWAKGESHCVQSLPTSLMTILLSFTINRNGELSVVAQYGDDLHWAQPGKVYLPIGQH